MKFRKKPVVIEAIQFLGYESYLEMCRKWPNFHPSSNYVEGSPTRELHLIIHTLEGDHKAILGDFIIKGIKGEFYPCKKDIFEATYDLENQQEGRG